MKRNTYFKAKLVVSSDEEALYNTFPVYVVGTLDLFIMAILQGELNTFSVCMLVMATAMACIAAYKIGLNSTKR